MYNMEKNEIKKLIEELPESFYVLHTIEFEAKSGLGPHLCKICYLRHPLKEDIQNDKSEATDQSGPLHSSKRDTFDELLLQAVKQKDPNAHFLEEYEYTILPRTDSENIVKLLCIEDKPRVPASVRFSPKSMDVYEYNNITRRPFILSKDIYIYVNTCLPVDFADGDFTVCYDVSQQEELQRINEHTYIPL